MSPPLSSDQPSPGRQTSEACATDRLRESQGQQGRHEKTQAGTEHESPRIPEAPAGSMPGGLGWN